MGNFEKLVVLAVLFLSAIVLAVSLNRGGDETLAAGPVDAAQAQIDPGRVEDARAAEEGLGFEAFPEEEATAPPGYLLYGETRPPEAELVPPVEEPLLPTAPYEEATGLPRILKTTRGLVPSAMEDFMVYEVVAGDTWAGLAERFYSDARYAANLRMANEDLTALGADTAILVPVYDFAEEAGVRSAWQPTPAPAGPGQKPTPAPTSGVDYSKVTVYEVRSGDSLSKVSLLVYGSAARWKEIFDANRDQLSSPHWLELGTKLVIPRGEGRTTAQVPSDRPRVR